MNHSKREREILHNYLEELGKHYESIEPAEAADSMCKIYNSLAITEKFRCILGTAVFANFFVCLIIFIYKFFWSKTR